MDIHLGDSLAMSVAMSTSSNGCVMESDVQTVLHGGAIVRSLEMSERNRGNGEHDSVSAAVRWLLKVEHDDPSKLSDEDLQAWASWAAEPANLKRFRLAQRIWRSLNSAPAGVGGTRPG